MFQRNLLQSVELKIINIISQQMQLLQQEEIGQIVQQQLPVNPFLPMEQTTSSFEQYLMQEELV